MLKESRETSVLAIEEIKNHAKQPSCFDHLRWRPIWVVEGEARQIQLQPRFEHRYFLMVLQTTRRELTIARLCGWKIVLWTILVDLTTAKKRHSTDEELQRKLIGNRGYNPSGYLRM